MITAPEHAKFSWDRVRGLFGLPFRDPRVQALFLEAGVDPERLWREVRVGIYAMPPHDKEPCPTAEVDLVPSFRVRIRFKHASLVSATGPVSSTTFVLAAVTYFLESTEELKPFRGLLPFGILATDNLERIAGRVGSPPTSNVFTEGEELGYAIWEDRDPRLHVLYNAKEDHLVRVNVFLAPRAT